MFTLSQIKMQEDSELEQKTRKGNSGLKDKESQLAKDFQAYDIPLRIKERSAQIYMLILNGDTFKRGRRRAMMCKCSYEAFKENNMPRDPIILAKLFDIDVKQLRDAQDEFYARIHGTDLCTVFPKRHLTAKELLPDIAITLRPGDEEQWIEIEAACELIDKLYASSELMARVSPRDIAISLIHWYRNVSGSPISVPETQRLTNIARAKLKMLTEAYQSLVA